MQIPVYVYPDIGTFEANLNSISCSRTSITSLRSRFRIGTFRKGELLIYQGVLQSKWDTSHTDKLSTKEKQSL